MTESFEYNNVQIDYQIEIKNYNRKAQQEDIVNYWTSKNCFPIRPKR